MTHVHLIIPMAGRGSRFSQVGIREPKPLIELNGRPFFWWAVESVRRAAPLNTLTFVVLRQHIHEWSIDERIRTFYPDAAILPLDQVTSGAAETAYLAAQTIPPSEPLAVNDCDHAFKVQGLPSALDSLSEGRLAGTLLTFRSSSPNYSYLSLSSDGTILGVTEKQVVSPFAVAGCYLFRDATVLLRNYLRSTAVCSAPERYISNIFNSMASSREPLGSLVLEEHFAFGTPDEFVYLCKHHRERLSAWLGDAL